MTMIKRKYKHVALALCIALSVFAAFTAVASAANLDEGFEGGTIPCGWTVIDNDGDGRQWEATDESPDAHEGDYVADVGYNYGGNDDWLVTPTLRPDAGNHTISFWYRSYNEEYGLEDFNVKLSTTGTDISDFTVTLDSITDAPTAWTHYTKDLSAYNGDDIHIAVQCVSVNKWYLWVDDFTGPPIASVPKSLSSLTVNQASTDSVGTGSNDNPILRLDFDVTGNTGTFTLNSIEVEPQNTDNADVTANGVKLYRTTCRSTTFSTDNLLGTAQSFSSPANFSSLNYNLPEGMTYVWVTYDVASDATAGNTLDAKILAGKVNVNGSTYPAGDQDPAGSREIAGFKEIGTGTSEGWRVPFYGSYDYGWSKIIYTQSEIGEAITINKIAFDVSNTPSSYTTNDQRIYMAHTTDSTFANGNKPDPATMTEVYTGSITWDGSGWHIITLDTAFSYGNVDNLLIYYENRDGSGAYGYPKWYYTSKSDRAARKYQESSFPTGAGTVSYKVPNVRLYYGAAGPAPAPPNITSFAPPSPVNDTVCNWRRFNVTVNQTVNVSWYLNTTLQHTNVSTKEANYTLHAEVVGEHNVSAIASNANGTDMQTWVWNVAAAPLPVLEINKTDVPDPVSPGGILNYSIRVNNTGNATATNVIVTETYDEKVTFLDAVPAPSQGSGTWVFATLNVGEMKWINISVAVNASVPNGTVLHNFVNVTCDEGVTDSDTEDTTVFVAPAPPNITSFAPPSPVNDTICNWRTFNVTVNQTVNVSWYLNNSFLFKNESVREANYTLHAEVVGEHNVSAKAENANGTDMQTWVWNVTVAPVPVLEINKTDVPDPVPPGDTLNYSISVHNEGNATATNVAVTETYDVNVTFVAAVPAPSQGNDTWIFATLNVSETRWINISVTVNASVLNGTVLHNIVNVTCDEGVMDSDTEDTTVLAPPAPPPKIISFAPPSPVNDTVCSWRTFNVTVNQTVNVSWYLNKSFLFTNASVREASCMRHAEVAGEHNVSAVASNANGTDMQTWIWNVTGAVPPAPPRISVNKVADPPDVAPASNVEFTITVPNTGDCTLDQVRVVDTLPAWMSYVSSSPAADTRHDGTIIWNNVGPLDPGASKTITLVALIASDASGTLTNAVTVTGTSSMGEEVTDSDTVTVTVLARTIEPPTKTLIDVTTEIKSDGIVIEGEQFGWMTGNGNLFNNPPLAPGEAVGSIKYDDKMIGSNGTTEFTKNFGVNTNVTPNLAVTKDIGYKSGDLGSLSYDEQVGMRYSGASPPLSSTTKCEDVNAYSEMVVTDVSATTETEVGITETDERDIHYGINAEGKGSVSAGVDASTSSMSYKDKSNAYGGNFSLHKKVDYTSRPSTSITTDLKGDRTVVEKGQFGWESGNRSLLHNEKMIGSNGTTEFEKCVDVSTSNIEVAKSIGYKSGDLGSLSHAEQVGIQYSSNTKCEDVNAYGEMVVTNATTKTEVGITERSLYYGIDAEGNGSVSAGVDASVDDGRTDMTYKDKSNAYGNFTFEKKIGYNKPP